MAVDETTSRALVAAISRLAGVRSILQTPCGGGSRIAGIEEHARYLAGTDSSMRRLSRRAAASATGNGRPPEGLVRATWRDLPFGEATFDCVVSATGMDRFSPNGRRVRLAELRRVTRRWVVVPYTVTYGGRYRMLRVQEALGRTKIDRARRLSREQIEWEMRRCGLSLAYVQPIGGMMSDRWVVVGEAPSHNRL